MFSLDDGSQLHGFLEKWIFVLPLEDHAKWKEYFFSQGIDDPEYLKDMTQNSLAENVATSYHHERGYMWDPEVGTSFFAKNSQIEYDEFKKNVAQPKCDDLLAKMKYTKFTTHFEFWHQNYNDNGYHGPHDHKSSLVSGIYLLELERENTTIFYSKKDNREHSFELNNAKEGDLILFDPSIWHSVNPCDGKKISVCFNVV